MLYELSHVARGLFGILMAEALYVRGSGRNGKDTACNAMQKVGGTYVQSISCDSLCNITSADGPSPTFYSVRGRRIVCVREVATDAKILPAVYKKFTDPFSEIDASSGSLFAPRQVPAPIPCLLRFKRAHTHRDGRSRETAYGHRRPRERL